MKRKALEERNDDCPPLNQLWDDHFRCSMCFQRFKTEHNARNHINSAVRSSSACANAVALRGSLDLSNPRGNIGGNAKFLPVYGPALDASTQGVQAWTAQPRNSSQPVSFLPDPSPRHSLEAPPSPPEMSEDASLQDHNPSNPELSAPALQAPVTSWQWNMQAFTSLLVYLRTELFSGLSSPLGSFTSSDFRKLAFESTEKTVYSPSVIPMEGYNVGPNVYPFHKHSTSGLFAFAEATQMTRSEKTLLSFCNKYNLSVDCFNELLRMIKDLSFKPEEIKHKNIQQYRTEMKKNIPDTFEYTSCDIEIGSWYEQKKLLVDDRGQPIQLTYRNAWRGLLNQWSDRSLAGKIYIAPRPNFRDGERIYSNFGDSLVFQLMQETVGKDNCAACALFASDEAIVHGSLTLYPILCCLANLHEDLRSKGSPYWFVVAYVPSVKSEACKNFFTDDLKSSMSRMRQEDLQREIMDFAVRKVLEGMDEIMEHGALTVDCNGDRRIAVPRVVGWLADGAEIPRLVHMAPYTCHICDRPKDLNHVPGWTDSDKLVTKDEIVKHIENVRKTHWDFDKNCIKTGHIQLAENELKQKRLQLSLISPLSGPLWFIPYFEPGQMVSRHGLRIHTHTHTCMQTDIHTPRIERIERIHIYHDTYIHTFIRYTYVHRYIRHTCIQTYIHAYMHACMHATFF
jgi:hypothetical protein